MLNVIHCIQYIYIYIHTETTDKIRLKFLNKDKFAAVAPIAINVSNRLSVYIRDAKHAMYIVNFIKSKQEFMSKVTSFDKKETDKDLGMFL